jgi:hypothetical protein
MTRMGDPAYARPCEARRPFLECPIGLASLRVEPNDCRTNPSQEPDPA